MIAETELNAEPTPFSGRVLPYGKDVEVFYDGGCPLCQREIAMLKRLDRLRRIQFTDIVDSTFDPTKFGLNHDQVMAEIHGRLPDGTVIKGVEVFRRLYAAVGYRWLTSLTRLPGLSQLLNIGYSMFAKNRLKLTGRCTPESCSVDPSK
ncbi:thiol-disulfide oxidoreductase DCC family protein [Planctomicrobium piriforme]|uniref:Predicted thiol-disulfide oxidoreductase YuxK, DCC family n=1 Tax=Planctomicrobium piriforme TaxID=1576369 RepID=A0A1I3C159_9PLAN|nr:DUF393 domain-containing protein [Planctomicrobium piriforme]SFH68358.1 Predicted thiol-disulfide oxidoreductase YuxK, DCC family [Planctomicrobium piriforme]